MNRRGGAFPPSGADHVRLRRGLIWSRVVQAEGNATCPERRDRAFAIGSNIEFLPGYFGHCAVCQCDVDGRFGLER